MKELVKDSIESSEMVEETFKFWFSDNEHIRSPFPEYIRTELKEIATVNFFNWVSTLNPDAKDEVNDEIVSEKFEGIIFETALELVKTDDERITIQYPFLPRLNDEITSSNENGGEEKNLVKNRGLIKEGDVSYLKVELERLSNKETWETKFELPL